MTDLQALKKELAEKLKAKDEAILTAIKAEELYTIAFNKWQSENAEVVSASNIADEQERIAKAEFSETRKRVIDQLSKHFVDHPEDKEEVKAFTFIRRKEPVWWMVDPKETLIKAGASFLLKVDDSALQTFVNNMSKENGDSFVLPASIMNWLPGLMVRTAIKGTVSDKKLQSD